MSPDVLHAGRYAVYVGSAYGISAVVLAAIVVEALLRGRRWRRRAERAGRDPNRGRGRSTP